jgi:hypothetical protein
MAVSINVSGSASTKKLKTFKRGRVFTKGNNAYILAIHNGKGGTHMAALVNIKTGDSIRRLKVVASATMITKAELGTLSGSSVAMLD